MLILKIRIFQILFWYSLFKKGQFFSIFPQELLLNAILGGNWKDERVILLHKLKLGRGRSKNPKPFLAAQ